jgi:mannitol/fructose-specific phosphotransferase system IIA component (Ntr-type)
MEFWKHFKAKTCTLRLGANEKEGVLTEVIDVLVASGALPEELRAGAQVALLEREKAGSTGVGMNVAIPHVKLKGLDRVACSLSVHEEGVAWAAVDGAPVHIVFTVLRPERASDQHDPEKHLEMMKWIARLSRDADFRRFALKVKTKSELVDLLKEKSTV